MAFFIALPGISHVSLIFAIAFTSSMISHVILIVSIAFSDVINIHVMLMLY